METKILKVVRQGEAFSVQSAKAETGTIQKCNIVLRELGGKFENEYVCMCVPCWAIWQGAGFTRAMWLSQRSASRRTNIRGRFFRKS